jgi:hypothetical protein
MEEKNPLDDRVVNYLLSKKSESADLDFKLVVEIKKDSQEFPKIAKDIFAMSNYGGGYILVGFEETPTGTVNLVGLPEEFHIDQASLQEKFNSYSENPIGVEYREIVLGKENKKIGIIYVSPSRCILKPSKAGEYIDKKGKQKIAFQKGEVLFRRGTQSVPATAKEIEFIKSRSEKTDYQISLLSGKPDQVEETLTSNIFEVISFPEFIYSAPFNGILPAPDIQRTCAYVINNSKIISFWDLNQTPLNRLIGGVVEKYQTMEFADKNPQIIIALLNYEIRAKTIGLKLAYLDNTKRVFFPSENSERKISWAGRYRESERQIVSKINARQLKREIYLHTAASIQFVKFDKQYFVKIVPTFVLTEDGKKTIKGLEEGTVITSITFNQFNNSFLLNVLFWVSQLEPKGGYFSFHTDQIKVAKEPSFAKIDFGILNDLPSKLEENVQNTSEQVIK